MYIKYLTIFIHQIILEILANPGVILFKKVLHKFLLLIMLPFAHKSQIDGHKRYTAIDNLHPWDLFDFLLHLIISY